MLDKRLSMLDFIPLPLDFAPGLMIQMFWTPSMLNCGLTCSSFSSMAWQQLTELPLLLICAPPLREKAQILVLLQNVFSLLDTLDLLLDTH